MASARSSGVHDGGTWGSYDMAVSGGSDECEAWDPGQVSGRHFVWSFSPEEPDPSVTSVISSDY